MRLLNFIAIDQFIEEWNAQEDKTHTVGHNFLSDWTQDEKDIISGKAARNHENLPQYEGKIPQQNVGYPEVWNWNNGKNVGAVQNQRQCGDCYAFSSTGAVQSAMSITYDKQVELYSVQQVTSCSNAYGNNGCNGGTAPNCFDYLQANPIVSAAVYPFNSGSGTCSACVA